MTDGEMEKLRRLLPHWIDHSLEHAHTFTKWADVARRLGYESLAQQLERAAMLTEESSDALRAGLEKWLLRDGGP